MKHLLLPVLTFLALATAVVPTRAQQQGTQGGQVQQPQPGAAAPAPGSREAMWYAPTAEDWAKPVLIKFQRTWEDAVAVSKETGRPILVCVNMDGEIASEHYAGVRYRQPEIAKLYEPYVSVIASVYRHNPRDHDEQGNRILCPRFGCVTCGEHIAMEPIVYEKFLDGRRIAPRHIMVELDGAEVYDVFYAFDTASVFKAIGDGITNRTTPIPPVLRGDVALVDKVKSRDVDDRRAVEEAFRTGDSKVRDELLAAALANPQAAPTDLLRLAVFGLDADQGRKARLALADAQAPEAADLIGETLRAPLETAEREALLAALDRLAPQSARARSLAVVHRGVARRSEAVDVDGWAKALEGGASYAAAAEEVAASDKVDRKAKEASAKPDDPAAQAGLAEALLAQVSEYLSTGARPGFGRSGRQLERLMVEDARAAARKAESMGAKGWAVHGTLAITAFQLGNYDEAYKAAELAMQEQPADPQGWAAMQVVAIFAEARQEAIVKAVRAKQEWPGQWLTDVHAAYSVLLRHPQSKDVHVANHFDFLKFFGGFEQANRSLDAGLKRFPESWVLHERLRNRILEERGVNGLESVYAKLLEEQPSNNMTWYAAYAALVGAEFHRRSGRMEQAVGSYDRALALYDRCTAENADSKANSDHYAALALAGKARLALEAGDLDRALELSLAGISRKPEATATLDGLNISPADTARMLRTKLREAQREEQLKQLQAVLDALDPELLELPAYEREGAPPQRGQGRRQRRNG
ncbi:MAG: hypothetical protein RL148_699 [Planctomycetota bacterium]|jgi:tetratricopeptide (TPR) repeat protein